jgi:hypothetical protein
MFRSPNVVYRQDSRGVGTCYTYNAINRTMLQVKRVSNDQAPVISRKNGASLEELMAALDWQKHSVRGFIATLGKTVRIESFVSDVIDQFRPVKARRTWEHWSSTA